MIKVSVMYPNSEGAKFDNDYYATTHIPMVTELLGSALKVGEINVGLAGGEPNSPAPFIAMGHMTFNSVEEFQSSFGPNASKIMGDLPNFTDIQPQIQISEIK